MPRPPRARREREGRSARQDRRGSYVTAFLIPHGGKALQAPEEFCAASPPGLEGPRWFNPGLLSLFAPVLGADVLLRLPVTVVELAVLRPPMLEQG